MASPIARKAIWLVLVSVGVAVAVGVLVLRPPEAPRPTEDPPADVEPGAAITAVRTAAGGEAGLVLAIVTNACAATPEVDVDEDQRSVAVALRPGIASVEPTPGQDCLALADGRTVSVKLRKPLGARTVQLGGLPVKHFDGSRLLRPSGPVLGLVLVAERGSAVPAEGQDITATELWEQVYKSGTVAEAVCAPPSLVLQQGPAGDLGYNPAGNWQKIGTERSAEFGDIEVLRRTPGGPPGAALLWQARGGSVALASVSECPDGLHLSAAELLRFADALE